MRISRILVLALICFIAYNADICGQTERERQYTMESYKKEYMNELKKKYKAKNVTIERLEDGNIYYLLHGKNNSVALVRENGEPLMFKGWAIYNPPKGKTREDANQNDFFYGYEPKVVYYGGKPYFSAKVVPDKPAGIFTMEGITIVPQALFPELKFEEREDAGYFRGIAENLHCYFRDNGDYVGKSNIADIQYYNSAPAGYTDPAKSKIGISIWHPAYDVPMIRVGQKDNNYIRDLSVNIGVPHPKYRPKFYKVILDGNYFAATGDNGAEITESNSLRDMGDGTTGLYKTLVIRDNFDKINCGKLYDRNWKLLADSCVRIIISDPDQIAYTYRYYGKPHFMYRKGAVSLTDSTLRIPPCFNDVIVRNDDSGNRVVYVKDKVFGDYRIYEPGDTGRLDFGDKLTTDFEKTYNSKLISNNPDRYSFLLTLGYLYKIPVDSLTQEQKAMFLYSIIDYARDGLTKQDKTLNAYNSGIDPQTKGTLKAYLRNISGVGLTNEGHHDYLSLHSKRLQELIDRADNPEDSVKYTSVQNNLRALMADIAFNRDIAIPQARDRFNVAQEQERQRLIREEEERQQAIRAERDARIAAAMVGMFSNIFNGVVNSGSKSHSSGGSYSSGKSYGRSSGGSGGGSSRPDNSGDKARLKREIADWEAKIKKAEASYMQALENYEKNKTWEAKRVVDSKLKTINEFTAERDRCISELNNLR